MTHDRKLELKRVYLEGYAAGVKACVDGAAEQREKLLDRFLREEEFARYPPIDPEQIAHSLPGRLRIVE